MNDTLSAPRLLEAADVAARIGVKESTVRQWVKLKKIPFTKVGKFTRFVSEDIDAWILSNRSGVPAAAE